MPIYDADLQAKEGFPDNAKRFKELVRTHAGLLIASPEYNWGVSGVLKNALDWASRAEGKDEQAYAATRGRYAALMSTAIGIYGVLAFGWRGTTAQWHALETAMQIMAITDGRVFSVHNAIVGRPSRPTPVVMTNLSTIKFNPYWNAPASIVVSTPLRTKVAARNPPPSIDRCRTSASYSTRTPSRSAAR